MYNRGFINISSVVYLSIQGWKIRKLLVGILYYEYDVVPYRCIYLNIKHLALDNAWGCWLMVTAKTGLGFNQRAINCHISPNQLVQYLLFL